MQVRMQVRADLRRSGDVHADALAGLIHESGYTVQEPTDLQALMNIVSGQKHL